MKCKMSIFEMQIYFFPERLYCLTVELTTYSMHLHCLNMTSKKSGILPYLNPVFFTFTSLYSFFICPKASFIQYYTIDLILLLNNVISDKFEYLSLLGKEQKTCMMY